MLTPYDWQEAIGHRAQYIESRLSHGTPVIAISIADGILLYTYRRQARKLFEIYDELAMAGMGQQSDVEAVRIASVDFAHQEGFNRSEKDVTIQRVVTAVSGPIKRAFADFSAAPVIARTLFVEVGPTPAQDQFVMVDYDGDFHARRQYGFLAPTPESTAILEEKLANLFLSTAAKETAIAELDAVFLAAIASEEIAKPDELTEGMSKEVAFLEREPHHLSRFRYTTEAEV
jgi:proteasome alpha subunit